MNDDGERTATVSDDVTTQGKRTRYGWLAECSAAHVAKGRDSQGEELLAEQVDGNKKIGGDQDPPTAPAHLGDRFGRHAATATLLYPLSPPALRGVSNLESPDGYSYLKVLR